MANVSKESKLHALLAVRSNLNGQATKVRTDLIKTFSSKRHLFEEKVITFESNEEHTTPVVESQSKIQSSVAQEIEWILPHLIKSLDVGYQVDVANMEAKADIVDENGNIIVANVPATTLLNLESRVREWKELIESIATLDPAKGFEVDTTRGLGYYQAREVVKTRTKKKKVVLSLAKATDKHPEQVQVYDEDVPIGKITEKEWSSLITPAIKAELLERVEELYRMVATARSKANEHALDVTNKKIGKVLLAYVFKSLEKSGLTVG